MQYRETKHSWECFLRGLPRGFQHGIGLKLPIWDQSLFCSSVRHRHPSCCPRPQQPLVSKLTGWHLAEAAKRRLNLSQVVLQGCSPRSEVEILVELVHLLVAHVLRPPCRAAMYFPSETIFFLTPCLASEQDLGLTRKILSSNPKNLAAFESQAAEHSFCSCRLVRD